MTPPGKVGFAGPSAKNPFKETAMSPNDPAALCAELIRFDTTNLGDGRSRGERECADFIQNLLKTAGYDARILGPSPDRASVVVRIPGIDSSLPGLLVHAHIDVVPAEPEQWSFDPFAGIIRDGYIYGRGASDMKDMAAMTLATLLDWAQAGVRPQRDIVVAFVADEEEKGDFGALWLVREHPELFAGVEAAIGESGGNATPLLARDGSTVMVYPVAAAERGTLHVRLRATGTSGHGSRPLPDSAVTALLDAVHQINHYTWPITLTETVRAYIEGISKALGHVPDLDTDDGIFAAVNSLGEAADVARATIRCSATTTVLRAGYKVNVIPGYAEAEVDVRCLPGSEEAVLATIDSMLGSKVSREFISNQPAVSSPVDSHWFDEMRRALVRYDPGAVVVPVCMGGGTDAKAFSALGIDCYGFSPLGADPEGRTVAGVHGIDERVPVASVRSGAGILSDFLANV